MDGPTRGCRALFGSRLGPRRSRSKVASLPVGACRRVRLRLCRPDGTAARLSAAPHRGWFGSGSGYRRAGRPHGSTPEDSDYAGQAWLMGARRGGAALGRRAARGGMAGGAPIPQWPATKRRGRTQRAPHHSRYGASGESQRIRLSPANDTRPRTGGCAGSPVRARLEHLSVDVAGSRQHFHGPLSERAVDRMGDPARRYLPDACGALCRTRLRDGRFRRQPDVHDP